VTASSGDPRSACLLAAARSYSTCPVALSADLLAPSFFWRVPVEEAEGCFARLEWGVYCGGTAWHLVQQLTAQGVEAFIYDFGPRGRSHVIALARVPGAVIALDPYLGHYLADGEGDPVVFELHLAALRTGGPVTARGRWARLPGEFVAPLLEPDVATDVELDILDPSSIADGAGQSSAVRDREVDGDPGLARIRLMKDLGFLAG
jgi:hypothetical protein